MPLVSPSHSGWKVSTAELATAPHPHFSGRLPGLRLSRPPRPAASSFIYHSLTPAGTWGSSHCPHKTAPHIHPHNHHWGSTSCQALGCSSLFRLPAPLLPGFHKSRFQPAGFQPCWFPSFAGTPSGSPVLLVGPWASPVHRPCSPALFTSPLHRPLLPLGVQQPPNLSLALISPLNPGLTHTRAH